MCFSLSIVVLNSQRLVIEPQIELYAVARSKGSRACRWGHHSLRVPPGDSPGATTRLVSPIFTPVGPSKKQ